MAQSLPFYYRLFQIAFEKVYISLKQIVIYLQNIQIKLLVIFKAMKLMVIVPLNHLFILLKMKYLYLDKKKSKYFIYSAIKLKLLIMERLR